MKCRLEAKVVPGSSRTEIVGWLGNLLKIKVAAPPEKGKANQAVIELLSERLQLNEESIAIVHGSSSQRKVIEINGITPQQLSHALPAKSA
tara:strand:+ start:6809 stop:7081 length:273 start_codon:yes stop_codon:yes gene_type:complete